MPDLYSERFFDWVDLTAARSAHRMLPIVQRATSPASITDVGCGRGIWLAEWAARGVAEIKGFDGDYVNRHRLAIDSSAFEAVDLSNPAAIRVSRRYDLAQSLEVAEHLPPNAALSYVAFLCTLSDVVLFSAAQPGQGGEDHVNERMPSYWAALFAQHGYAAFDCIRPKIVGVREISPWYRFNVILFANSVGVCRLSDEARAARADDLDKLDRIGNLAWQFRLAVLRPLPVTVVTWLSRRHYALAGTIARLRQEVNH